MDSNLPETCHKLRNLKEIPLVVVYRIWTNYDAGSMRGFLAILSSYE